MVELMKLKNMLHNRIHIIPIKMEELRRASRQNPKNQEYSYYLSNKRFNVAIILNILEDIIFKPATMRGRVLATNQICTQRLVLLLLLRI